MTFGKFPHEESTKKSRRNLLNIWILRKLSRLIIRHYEAGDIPYMMTVQIDAETGNCLDVKMVWNATLLSLSERFGM